MCIPGRVPALKHFSVRVKLFGAKAVCVTRKLESLRSFCGDQTADQEFRADPVGNGIHIAHLRGPLSEPGILGEPEML